MALSAAPKFFFIVFSAVVGLMVSVSI
jgi:hypothetical protein